MCIQSTFNQDTTQEDGFGFSKVTSFGNNFLIDKSFEDFNFGVYVLPIIHVSNDNDFIPVILIFDNSLQPLKKNFVNDDFSNGFKSIFCIGVSSNNK